MPYRALSFATGAIEVIGIATFLALGVEADRAMDKSGVGDTIKFGQFSGYASVAFYLAFLAWLACLIFSQLARQPYRGRALFWFGLVVPLGSFVVWFLLLGTKGA
jgi:hypothetical protein